MGKRVFITGVTLTLLFIAVPVAIAQWQAGKYEDPLHGKDYEEFVLRGKYLTAPSATPRDDRAPALIVHCSDGKFRSGEYMTGATERKSGTRSILKKAPQVKVEMRFDERKPTEDLWEVGNNGRTLFFDKIQLVKLMTGKMLGHPSKEMLQRLILGTVEEQEDRIVSQFDIPADAAAITKACDLEWGKQKIK